jgi:hypothetical protein
MTIKKVQLVVAEFNNAQRLALRTNVLPLLNSVYEVLEDDQHFIPKFSESLADTAYELSGSFRVLRTFVSMLADERVSDSARQLNLMRALQMSRTDRSMQLLKKNKPQAYIRTILLTVKKILNAKILKPEGEKILKSFITNRYTKLFAQSFPFIFNEIIKTNEKVKKQFGPQLEVLDLNDDDTENPVIEKKYIDELMQILGSGYTLRLPDYIGDTYTIKYGDVDITLGIYDKFEIRMSAPGVPNVVEDRIHEMPLSTPPRMMAEEIREKVPVLLTKHTEEQKKRQQIGETSKSYLRNIGWTPTTIADNGLRGEPQSDWLYFISPDKLCAMGVAKSSILPLYRGHEDDPWRNYGRLGVDVPDQSIYNAGTQDIESWVKRVTKDAQNLKDTKERGVLVNFGPRSLTLTPERLAQIVDILKSGRTFTVGSGGFGTYTIFSTNSRGSPASKQITELVGQGVYYRQEDRD